MSKLCIRGDIQLRVKLVKHARGDSRVSRARRIVSGKPSSTKQVPSPPGPPRSPQFEKTNNQGDAVAKQVSKPQKDSTKSSMHQKRKKKKKKRIISFKADYSHIKSKTDCYNDIAYPVADEVKYARQKQQQQHPGRQHYENSQPVIGESTFPLSAHIDLSADFDSGAHYTPSYGESTRQQLSQEPQIQERPPPLDTSTLMKMYYHGESTLSGLTAGRLQYADLERLQSQLESRDQTGESSREDSTSILPRLSRPRDMDQASYDVQVARLEQEYSQLGGAGV